LEKAELRHRRIHDLRHTFASLLIQQDESLVYVKEQMGHALIQITVDIYGHLVPSGTGLRSIGSTTRNRLHVGCTDPPQSHSGNQPNRGIRSEIW
jgi:site-specific recombinase XerD